MQIVVTAFTGPDGTLTLGSNDRDENGNYTLVFSATKGDGWNNSDHYSGSEIAAEVRAKYNAPTPDKVREYDEDQYIMWFWKVKRYFVALSWFPQTLGLEK